jgi:hypothetical protein
VGCIRIVLGLAFLLVGIASVAILVKIKGTSDGPGALVFYIGAFFGLGGAWALLLPTAPKE